MSDDVCHQCSDDNKGKAEYFCHQCKFYLCTPCMQGRLKIPDLKSHRYERCEVYLGNRQEPPPSPKKTGILTLQRQLYDAINNQQCIQTDDSRSEKDVNNHDVTCREKDANENEVQVVQESPINKLNILQLQSQLRRNIDNRQYVKHDKNGKDGNSQSNDTGSYSEDVDNEQYVKHDNNEDGKDVSSRSNYTASCSEDEVQIVSNSPTEKRKLERELREKVDNEQFIKPVSCGGKKDVNNAVVDCRNSDIKIVPKDVDLTRMLKVNEVQRKPCHIRYGKVFINNLMDTDLTRMSEENEVREKIENEQFIKTNSSGSRKDVNNHAVTCRNGDIKIVPKDADLTRMLEVNEVQRKPWYGRYGKVFIGNSLKNMRHLKTIDKLQCAPYRIGLVCDNLWIRSGDITCSNIVVYDKNLEFVREIDYLKYVNTVVQVDGTEILVAGADGLFVANTQGKIQYKVLCGMFTDIATDGRTVIAIDCTENTISTLCKIDGKWCKFQEIDINDTEREFVKTVHMLNNDIFVSICEGHRIYKYSVSGKLVQSFGKQQNETFIASWFKQGVQFHWPYICGSDFADSLVVCDRRYNRFQILHEGHKWEQIKVRQIQDPIDIIMQGSDIFVLHGRDSNRKLSKFTI